MIAVGIAQIKKNVIKMTKPSNTLDKILEEMRANDIQVSNYFSPVHLQPFMVEQFGYKKGDFPVTESVSQRTIALPFYNNLTRDEVAIVCKTLKNILDKNPQAG